MSIQLNDPVENQDYLSSQIVTYLGNKRALLQPIDSALRQAKRRLGKRLLRVFDPFSGSGIVSRFLKAHASYIASNDIEDYAAVIGRCFLTNKGNINYVLLSAIVEDINNRTATESTQPGFFEEIYAPGDEDQILEADRVFYTPDNARRLDGYRRMIDTAPVEFRDLLLGPLLSEASIHANTAGVFKGFYKNRATGIGQFGGSGSDALVRIKGQIKLAAPVLSNFECEYEVFQGDANTVAVGIAPVDIAYIDPPYNQHPYGSNYFMLNLLVNYERPEEISRVAGIPRDWRRSDYNIRAKSLPLLRRLLNSINAPFLLVAFNDEGFIPIEEMNSMLSELGSVEVIKTRHAAFRGSRNFKKRPLHVTEHLFLVERH